MILSVAIQHHPKRADLLGPLLEAMPEAAVVLDPEPDKLGCWAAANAAWEAHDPLADHHMVVEDDAVLCRDFLAGVELALEARPDNAICFYSNTKAIEEAREKGWSWVYCRGDFYNCQAFVLPTGWIREFLGYANSDGFGQGRGWDPTSGTDIRVNAWLKDWKERVLLSAPSLVEHGQPGDSLLWGPHGYLAKRTARWWIGPDASPLMIDWTKGEGRA